MKLFGRARAADGDVVRATFAAAIHAAHADRKKINRGRAS
jgi:hypothetical protein